MADNDSSLVYERRAALLQIVNSNLREQVKRLEEVIHRQRKQLTAVQEALERRNEENAKLRDAMYTSAGKHALQHMDEDELRIWATQQADYINELKELCYDMWICVSHTGGDCTGCQRDPDILCTDGISEFLRRVQELGIEVDA